MESSPFTIRPATAADIEGIARLRAMRRGTPDEARAWVERVVGGMEAKPARKLLLCAEAEGQIAAYAFASHWGPPTEGGETGSPEGYYLLGLMVDPDWRRQGIARALTRARLNWIAEHAGEAWYFSDDDNKASNALHRGLGFQPVTSDFTFPGLANPEEPMTLYRLALG